MILTGTEEKMPYSLIENMYKSLTAEKQSEIYDYLCFLVSKKDNLKQNAKSSYSNDFFSLFGSVKDSTFVEPEDAF